MKQLLPTDGQRQQATAAVHEAIAGLDETFARLEPVRPFQAWRWRTTSRRLFLGEAQTAATDHLWEIAADLRALIEKCRQVADAELDAQVPPC